MVLEENKSFYKGTFKQPEDTKINSDNTKRHNWIPILMHTMPFTQALQVRTKMFATLLYACFLQMICKLSFLRHPYSAFYQKGALGVQTISHPLC